MKQPASTLKTLVIGAGSWGTALAAAACQQSHTLLLARDPEQARHIHTQHRNPRYLSDCPLPPTLEASADVEQAIQHLKTAPEQSLIILGVPVVALPHTLREWYDYLDQAQLLSQIPIIWTCKGFSQQTGQLPHEVIKACGNFPHTGVLSGPSFAKEVVQQQPVALTLASHSPLVQERTTAILHNRFMRIYRSTDIIGVEVGGAIKNIIAIACGIADGLALGNNARAALITRGLAEMSRLGLAMGGQAETFAGLSGLGDLVLTATGDLSRNRQVGLALGQGKTAQEILSSGITAEGVRCARDTLQRATTLGVPMPITKAVCEVLFEEKPPMTAVQELLAREAKTE